MKIVLFFWMWIAPIVAEALGNYFYKKEVKKWGRIVASAVVVCSGLGIMYAMPWMIWGSVTAIMLFVVSAIEGKRGDKERKAIRGMYIVMYFVTLFVIMLVISPMVFCCGGNISSAVE